MKKLLLLGVFLGCVVCAVKGQTTLSSDETNLLKQHFVRSIDDVRGVTFVEPLSMKGTNLLQTDCSLYVSVSSTNAKPALLFYCGWIGEDAEHFDEMLFRVKNTTYTIKMPEFKIADFGGYGKYKVVANTFPITRWFDRLTDTVCDNEKAIEALVSVHEEQKIRFHSSTYRTSNDIILTPEKLSELRLAYRTWKAMCAASLDVSFLKSEDDLKAEESQRKAKEEAERNRKLQAVTHQWEVEEQQRQAAQLQAEYERQKAERLEALKKQQATQSKVLAFRLQSATNGLPTAQYQVGMAYLNGEGVETNKGLAVYWLSKAAAQGNEEAKAKLSGLNAP
jgi:hypothetical protein